MDPDFADPVSTCGFPSTVGVNGALCQGAFVGRGLVITAAHCVDETGENPASIHFGDEYKNSSQAEITYDNVDCELHPCWDSAAGEGVDLAICDLEDLGLDVPPAVMTPPDGCEVSYLRHLLRNVSTCTDQTDFDCHDGIVGVHSSAGPHGSSGDSGEKQYGDSAVVLQENWEGSPSALLVSVPGTASDHLASGDSGAPFYMEMPDGSWRFLGVHSGRQAGSMYTQAAPPHIDFLENANSVFFDATPCHDLSGLNGWEYTGGTSCVNALHTEPMSPGATWGQDCNDGSDFGGGADACGGWFMGIAQPPDPEFHSPEVDPTTYDIILSSVESDVKDQTIACSTAEIEDAINEEGEYHGWWPFVTEPRDVVGTVTLYDESPADAVLIFRELCS